MSEDKSNNNKNDNHDDDEDDDSFGQWVQDNLRIIISIIIVILLVIAIYSFSQRTHHSSKMQEDDSMLLINDEYDEEKYDENDEDTEETTSEKKSFLDHIKGIGNGEKDIDTIADENSAGQQTSDDAQGSKETASAFEETVAAGEGATHLARRALANHLEKNPDTALTAAHKVYIEDYMQKNITTSGNLAAGEKVSFSKDLIKDAIAKAKALNDTQLQNLQKYAANVTAL